MRGDDVNDISYFLIIVIIGIENKHILVIFFSRSYFFKYVSDLIIIIAVAINSIIAQIF